MAKALRSDYKQTSKFDSILLSLNCGLTQAMKTLEYEGNLSGYNKYTESGIACEQSCTRDLFSFGKSSAPTVG